MSEYRVRLTALMIVLAVHAGIWRYLAVERESQPVFLPPATVSVTMESAPRPMAEPPPEPSPSPAAPPESWLPPLPQSLSSSAVFPDAAVERARDELAEAEPPAASAPAAIESPPAHAAPSAPLAVEAPIESPRFDAAYLNNPKPKYPRLLEQRGIGGRVLVRAEVQPDGRCGQVRLIQSSGFKLFDDAALAAVKEWRFVPARRNGQAVSAWVDVPIIFKPENAS